MSRIIMLCLGIGLLAFGVVLLSGLNESDSFSSGVSRVFAGNPTDRAMYLMVAGIGLGVVGAVLTLLTFRRRS